MKGTSTSTHGTRVPTGQSDLFRRDNTAQRAWKVILVISALELGLVPDVLEDRSKEKLVAWLEERGEEWRAGVEVACSDIWDAYQEAVA
jgi:transposase